MSGSLIVYKLWTFIKNPKSNLHSEIIVKDLQQCSHIYQIQAMAIYKTIADDRFHKISRQQALIVDRRLQDIAPYPRITNLIKINPSKTNSQLHQPSGEGSVGSVSKDERSLQFNIMRLRFLMANDASYEEGLKSVLDEILVLKKINYSDLLSCGNLLKVDVQHKSSNYVRLMAGIIEIFEQQICGDKLQLNPTMIISVYMIIDKSLYKIPKKLTDKLNQLIDKNVNSFSAQELFLIFNSYQAKTITIIEKIARIQNSFAKKRVIYKLLAKKLQVDQGIQEKILPGKQITSENQLNLGLGVVRSSCYSEPFFDIFPYRFAENPKKTESTEERKKAIVTENTFLDHPFLNAYIEHLFYFLSLDLYKIDQESCCRIVSCLRTLMNGEPDEKYQERYCLYNDKRNINPLFKANVDHLKLFIVLITIKNYCYENLVLNKELEKLIKMSSDVISYEYVKNYRFQELMTFSQGKYLLTFLMTELIKIYKCKINLMTLLRPTLDLIKIQLFLNMYQHKRYNNPFADTAKKLLKWVNSEESTQKLMTSEGNYTDKILFFNILSTKQLQEILERTYEKDPNGKNEAPIQDLLRKIENEFHIYKDLTIQPEINIKYLILTKKNKIFYAAYDYDQFVSLEGRCLDVNQNETYKSIFQEEEHLNVGYEWRRQFFSEVLACKYQYAADNLELSRKFYDMFYRYFYD